MFFQLLDIVSIVIVLGSKILPRKLLVFSGLYLLLKGLVFAISSKDFASYIDTFFGVYLIAMFFGLRIYVLSAICVLWLIQKTVMYFILR